MQIKINASWIAAMSADSRNIFNCFLQLPQISTKKAFFKRSLHVWFTPNIHFSFQFFWETAHKVPAILEQCQVPQMTDLIPWKHWSEWNLCLLNYHEIEIEFLLEYSNMCQQLKIGRFFLLQIAFQDVGVMKRYPLKMQTAPMFDCFSGKVDALYCQPFVTLEERQWFLFSLTTVVLMNFQCSTNRTLSWSRKSSALTEGS